MRSRRSRVTRFLQTIFVTGPRSRPSASGRKRKNVSMAMALAIIQGTIEQCTKDGYKVSVTVVDKAGNVAGSVRGRRHQSPHHGIQPTSRPTPPAPAARPRLNS